MRDLLLERARMLKEVRKFFSVRGVIEVDTPALSSSANIDLHIDVMHTEAGYLHTSPEYGMKKLLGQGSGDIYQMSHVFRLGEYGALHSPEFTMVEWYRGASTFDELICECAELCRLFLGQLPLKRLSYSEAFQRFAGIDSSSATNEQLLSLCREHGILSTLENPETSLQMLFGLLVEPHLQELTAIVDFPVTQAALAVCENNVAKRFELYYKGIELANGYQELTDADEQRKRFEKTNQMRKRALPIDEDLLAAMKTMPPCVGVAVGFDRLLMLKLGKRTLAEVLPISSPGR